MNRFRSKGEDDYYSIFSSLIMIRFVILVLILIFLAPKQESKDDEKRDRGNIRVEVTWEKDKDVDVDLWVQSPDDPKPVGWRNKNGVSFDLIRDDLGNINSPNGIHYEIAYSRSVAPGEYIVNLHLFANRQANYPEVPTKIYITHSKDDNGKSSQQQVYQKDVTLKFVGEEVTVIRFEINQNGEINRNSFGSLFRPLYTER